MKKKTLKGKIKVGHILVDDVEHAYRVLEVFTNSIVVSPIKNIGDFSCEIMSYESMDNEQWLIAK